MNNDFFTTTDGTKIFITNRQPAGAPKAVVLVVHGYGEHCGRYKHVMQALVEAGYAAYALDHVGHGQSDGLRAFIKDFDRPVTHMKEYLDRIKPQHPGKPVFVLGHSMGALISLAFTLRYQSEIAGLLISGAPVNADANVSPLMIQLGYVLNRIVPTLPLMPSTGNDVLSTDPQVVIDFNNDPLNYKANMRVGLGVALNETAKKVRGQLANLTLPLLVMHGAEDQLVNPSGSQLTYERASSKDKTLKLYPGMRHEIMNEREKATVLREIIAWLDSHV